MNPDKRKNLLIAVLGICLAGFVGDRFVLTPLIENWKTRSKSIAALKVDVSEGQGMIDRERFLRNDWKAANAAALPDDAASAEHILLTAANDRAVNAGLRVTSLVPHWIEDEERGPRLEVRVSAEGGLRDSGKFVYAVETDEIPIRLDSVELRALDDKGARMSVEARLTALTVASTIPLAEAEPEAAAAPAQAEDAL